MKKITKKIYNRIIALLLIPVTVLPLLTGCGGNVSISTDNVSVDQIAQAIIDDIEEDSLNSVSTNEIIVNGENLFVSDNWEDYICDVETFVYGLLSTQMQYCYDVFPACVDLEDGTTVYGIGYTDFEDCYTNEEETEDYVLAGLVTFCGETEIPEEDFDEGLFMYDMECDTDINFLLGYQSDSFTKHCVVYGQYVRYGIDDNSQIFYEYEPYDQDSCDESLGSLYSFDDSKYLYDDGLGEYDFISGNSLSSQIDFDALEDEINGYLGQQDIDFSSVDIESNAYFSQETVVSYFLSLQEETFLGYDVDYLVELAEELDPLECYQITSDGLLVLDLVNSPDEETALVNFLVGSGCVIVTALSLVGSVACMECPILSASLGAITGVAIEVFIQVVFECRSIDDIDWVNVALAAATGAIAGFLGPYTQAISKQSKVLCFIIDSAIDGVLGGIEHSVINWIDGGDADSIIQSFGIGFALGFGLSAAFKGATSVLSGLANKISPYIDSAIGKIAPNLKKKTSDIVTKLTDQLSIRVGKLKNLVDGNELLHSGFLAKNLSERAKYIELNVYKTQGDSILEKKSYNALRVENIYDLSDNPIKKSDLIELFEKASDGDVIAHYKIDGEVVDIKKMNGMYGIFFDEKKYQSVVLKGELMKNDRDDTFKRAAELFKEDWLEHPEKMPQSIKEMIDASGISLENMDADYLVENIIQKSDYVLHENIDLKTVTLVARTIHDKANETGIGHMGGFGLANYLKYDVSANNFDQLVSAAASGAVIVEF